MSCRAGLVEIEALCFRRVNGCVHSSVHSIVHTISDSWPHSSMCLGNYYSIQSPPQCFIGTREGPGSIYWL